MKQKVSAFILAAVLFGSVFGGVSLPVRAASTIIADSGDFDQGVYSFIKLYDRAESGDTIQLPANAITSIKVSTSEEIDSVFAIEKSVTIQGQTGSVLSVGAWGLVLGADVNFNQVTFNSPTEKSFLFANGHKLTLNQVQHVEKTTDGYEHPIYVFGGKPAYGNVLDTKTGTKSVISITNSTIANVYAGSCSNGTKASFDIPVEISINSPQKMSSSQIYGSGATLNKTSGSVNKVPNTAANLCPVTTNPVQITVTDTSMKLIDGKQGNALSANVTLNANAIRSFDMTNVDSFVLNGGTFQPKNLLSSIKSISLKNNSILDLSELFSDNTAPVNIGKFNGNGGSKLILPTDKTLSCNTISGAFTAQIGNTNRSIPKQNHPYFEASSITDVPRYASLNDAQQNFVFEKQNAADGKTQLVLAKNTSGAGQLNPPATFGWKVEDGKLIARWSSVAQADGYYLQLFMFDPTTDNFENYGILGYPEFYVENATDYDFSEAVKELFVDVTQAEFYFKVCAAKGADGEQMGDWSAPSSTYEHTGVFENQTPTTPEDEPAPEEEPDLSENPSIIHVADSTASVDCEQIINALDTISENHSDMVLLTMYQNKTLLACEIKTVGEVKKLKLTEDWNLSAGNGQTVTDAKIFVLGSDNYAFIKDFK